MTSPEELKWLTEEPAGRFGPWEVYLTHLGNLLFRLEDTSLVIELQVNTRGASEVAIISPCCAGHSLRQGQVRSCWTCKLPLPYVEYDGDVVGEWMGAVEEWVEVIGGKTPLVAGLVASEIHEIFTSLSKIRLALHAEALETDGLEALVEQGEARRVFSIYSKEPEYALPWTLRSLLRLTPEVS